jgi:NTP pyrophosphatase (non-canonical NTP hydrolase)
VSAPSRSEAPSWLQRAVIGKHLDEYQQAAARTMNPALDTERRLMDAAAGLAEEAGEVLGQVRKALYVGHPLDRERLTKELGDALWCLAAMATTLDLPLSEVAAANLAKLRARFPDGFTAEASLRRADGE